MSRVTKQKVKRKFTDYTYRKALPYLDKDFQGRCAYSMRHRQISGDHEVDHFNPTLKSKHRNKYQNLLPSIRHCNGKKAAIWPSPELQAKGIRFLNPCLEQDYGQHIVENPDTHELVGLTPAGRFHIRHLDLNVDFLVIERRNRAVLRRLKTEVDLRYVGNFLPSTLEALNICYETLEQILENSIPPIPYLETGADKN